MNIIGLCEIDLNEYRHPIYIYPTLSIQTNNICTIYIPSRGDTGASLDLGDYI
jgi:hypothetical protein